LSVILPILKPLMHFSAMEVGVLAASSTVGITIGMIPAGLLADHFGRKPVLIGGVLWFSGLTLVSALAPDFRTLLILRGLSGLGMGATFIMPYALLVELVPSRTRAAFTENGEALVAVEDTGVGLDPASADRIFDPLFTTKPDGMGMGLSICRSIVETHSGRLWASPTLAHGAVMRFTAPSIVNARSGS
jgi:Major Facilitator Superfamily/Histidine kinase-, DNA gyrase B-, and HSP90-like ATPase